MDASMPEEVVVERRRRGSRARRAVNAVGLVVGLLVALLIGLTVAALVVMPPSTLMLARWATGEPVDRRPVPLAAIARVLPQTVIASEDARFCLHAGVDWDALRSVIEDAGDGGPSRGASTIAMQTAKNLFLWPDRSYVRKALEIPLALWIDLVWPKYRLMEIYLNIAEWGEGVFGAEAAAQTYFGKPAARLTAREAALLATALPSPLRRNAARPSPGHRRLADRLVARAARAAHLATCVREGREG